MSPLVLAFFLGAVPALAGGIVDRPEGCIQSGVYPCAVSAMKRERLSLKHKKRVVKLGLAEGSKLLLYAPDEAALIDGEAALLNGEPFRFRHGSVKIDFAARALVTRADRELVLIVFEGVAHLKKPHSPEEKLVSGLEQTVGAIDALSGAVRTRVAGPYEFGKSVPRWLRLAGVDRAEAVEHLEDFRALWKTSVEVAATGYAKEVGRQLASKEKRIEERIDAEGVKLRRDQRLRELFRSKTIDDGK